MTDTALRSLNGPPKTSYWKRQLWGFRFMFAPVETIEIRQQAYGDNYRVSSPDTKTPLVYFSTPEALEAIFTAKPEQLSAGGANQILRELLGDQGIVLLSGEAHKRHRQLLMPPFHGVYPEGGTASQRMRSYAQVIQAITASVIGQWRVGTKFAVRPAMQSISLQVILKAVFGLESGQRYEQIRDGLSQMLEGFGSPLGAMFLFYPILQQDWGAWSPWGRFLRLRQQVDDLLYAEIRDRQAHPDPDRTDILALMLAARDTEGQPMSEVELRDELVTLLFAGHETTASALAWALYWIVELPEVRQKLLAEIESLGPDADALTIARLPYLTAVCQETLRLYPIALSAFPRVLQQPMVIAGYALNPGTVVMPSIYLAHHRPAVYPEPKRFRPERFLERQFSPYEYLPFGGGDRRCIGSAFALFEMKLVLFQMLSKLELQSASAGPVKPSRRGLTVAPSSNLRMRVTGLRG